MRSSNQSTYSVFSYIIGKSIVMHIENRVNKQPILKKAYNRSTPIPSRCVALGAAWAEELVGAVVEVGAKGQALAALAAGRVNLRQVDRLGGLLRQVKACQVERVTRLLPLAEGGARGENDNWFISQKLRGREKRWRLGITSHVTVGSDINNLLDRELTAF